jgi:hypothetical protein
MRFLRPSLRHGLCTALLLVLSSALYAQGNLQFNQVKLITTSQTVPVGKLWKVESVQYNGGATFAINTAGPVPVVGTMAITVNGATLYVNTVYTSGSYAYPTVLSNGSSFPMWLPAGTTLAASTNCAFVNVIEFNVVP